MSGKDTGRESGAGPDDRPVAGAEGSSANGTPEGGDGRGAPAGSGGGSSVPRCPICGKPRDPGYRPFCSKRCADVDLGRWLTGSYAIPVREEEDEDGEAATPGTGARGDAGEP